MVPKPMEDGSLKSNQLLPVLHLWINLLKWFEQLNYYFNARLLTSNQTVPVRGQGRKKSDNEKAAITEASNNFRNLAKNGQLNLPLDRPDPTGNGGNSGIYIYIFFLFFSNTLPL